MGYQQDIVRTAIDAAGNRRRTLTQYKFSLDPTANPIRPKEFRAIHAALESSKNQADQLELLPTDLILKTNRPLSPRLKDGSSAAEACAHVKYQVFDPAESVSALHDYAKRFGLFESNELSDAVNRLINLLFMTAVSHGSKQIRRDQFDKALCGSSNPRSLVASELAPHLFRALEDQKQSALGVKPAIHLAARESVSTAVAGLIDEAIVVFIGKGGYGKTVALWQLLRTLGAPDAATTRLALFIPSGTARITLGELVSRCRVASGVTATHDADDVALARVVHANPKLSPPLLYLGLDGADERRDSVGWLETIAHVVNFFWQLHQRHKDSGTVPPARLMVSCRRKEDIEQFLEGSSGLGIAGKPPVYVTISEFSYEEFFAVCTAADVHPGAKAMLLTASGLGAKTITLSQPGRLDPRRDFDSTVTGSIDLLRHPVVWQCYCLLTAEDQSAFLRQDDTAVRKLSENYPCGSFVELGRVVISIRTKRWQSFVPWQGVARITMIFTTCASGSPQRRQSQVGLTPGSAGCSLKA